MAVYDNSIRQNKNNKASALEKEQKGNILFDKGEMEKAKIIFEEALSFLSKSEELYGRIYTKASDCERIINIEKSIKLAEKLTTDGKYLEANKIYSAGVNTIIDILYGVNKTPSKYLSKMVQDLNARLHELTIIKKTFGTNGLNK